MAVRSPMCPLDGVDDGPHRSIASLTFVSIGQFNVIFIFLYLQLL